ncbi:N-acetyltransferase, partial [Staphylococcus aureus]|uniref:N-acetyltransferase n=1 Tax=Staphylococcus aureus TaxID=1280 RepID=UPI00210D6FEF
KAFDKAITKMNIRTDQTVVIGDQMLTDVFGGQGVGKKLVKAVVEHARENHLKIIASCSFAKHMLEKEDSYQDVYLG